MFPIRFVEVAVLAAKQQRELQVDDKLGDSSDDSDGALAITSNGITKPTSE
jgi:hypothetical protein